MEGNQRFDFGHYFSGYPCGDYNLITELERYKVKGRGRLENRTATCS